MKSDIDALDAVMPKKRWQIHQSFMGTLWRCELQAMYRNLLGIRRPPRAFLHIGTGVHESVRADLQNKIDSGELMKRGDVVDLSAATFDERCAKDPIELEPDEKKEGKSVEQVKGESRDKTVALAGLHYDEVAHKLTPKLVEHPFSINMDKWLRDRAKMLHAAGDKEQDPDAAKMLHAEARTMNSASRLGIDLVGTRDVIEAVAPLHQDRPGASPRHRIRDTKTSGKSPNKNAADTSEQGDIYALASVVYEKELPESFVLDYLVQTPKRHDLKYVPLTSTRTSDDVNVVLYRFARAVHRWHTACKTGDFAPAQQGSWWCSEKFCGYADRCPAFKKPKLVQIGEVPE